MRELFELFAFVWFVCFRFDLYLRFDSSFFRLSMSIQIASNRFFCL